ncbi:hypothetical protein CsSME_00040598 [Camellia sinensis var. sinensis]
MSSPPMMKAPVRFTLGRQSSLEPGFGKGNDNGSDGEFEQREIDASVRLMYLANEGDLEEIKELLELGTDVNHRDIDDRTALHVAACHGSTDVVEFLLNNGAEIDPKDHASCRCNTLKKKS